LQILGARALESGIHASGAACPRPAAELLGPQLPILPLPRLHPLDPQLLDPQPQRLGPGLHLLEPSRLVL